MTAGFSSRLSWIAISGKTSWLITTSGTRKRRATTSAMSATIGGSVMHTTTSGRGPRIPATSAFDRYVT